MEMSRECVRRAEHEAGTRFVITGASYRSYSRPLPFLRLASASLWSTGSFFSHLNSTIYAPS